MAALSEAEFVAWTKRIEDKLDKLQEDMDSILEDDDDDDEEEEEDTDEEDLTFLQKVARAAAEKAVDEAKKRVKRR